jgi:carbamoylphosphate synthase large subunit
MTHVVFAVPFAMDATLRFVRAAVELQSEGLQVGVVSQEPLERFPPELRQGFAAYERVSDTMDPDRLTEGIRRIAPKLGGRVDRLIGILEPLQESLAQARANLGIPGMRPEAAHNFRDKARMKDLLQEHGLPCARHRLCHSAPQAIDFGQSSGYPLVVKPPAGAGAKNTFRVENERELEGYLRTMPPSAANPVLLEEFLVGREFSFDSVTLNGEHLLHSVTAYTPTPLEVMQTPWIQWTVMLPRDISGPEYEAIHEAGPRVLDLLGMDTGITHMEWFQREDGSIAISEVAARPPGAQFTTLLSYAYDLDFYKAWVRLVSMDRFEVPERSWSAGAAFLRGQGGARVSGIGGIEKAQEELGELVVEAKLPQAGQARASSYEGEGYVILRDHETARVREGLQKLVSMLRVEME